MQSIRTAPVNAIISSVVKLCSNFQNADVFKNLLIWNTLDTSHNIWSEMNSKLREVMNVNGAKRIADRKKKFLVSGKNYIARNITTKLSWRWWGAKSNSAKNQSLKSSLVMRIILFSVVLCNSVAPIHKVRRKIALPLSTNKDRTSCDDELDIW